MKFVNNKLSSTFDYEAERTCRNCGNVFNGRYCNRCGEKVTEPQDKSLIHIGAQLLNGFTFIDNRVLRTIRLMFFRTGELTLNFMNGVRVPFIRPISIFFIANLLYFLFPVFDTFNSGLRTQMHFLPHSTIARSMVEKRLEAENVTLKEFGIRYAQQSTNMAKLLLIVFVFLVAVPLALLNYSSRLFFYDHILASLEYNSMMIIVSQIVMPWSIIFIDHGLGLGGKITDNVLVDSVYSVIAAILSVLLFFLMEKRVYQQSNAAAWVKAILMLPCLFIAVQLYRVLLFFVTMATL